MKAQELRIGNWFRGDDTSQGHHQITAYEIFDFHTDPLDDYYQPIPLTEEWLLKFGEIKAPNSTIYCGDQDTESYVWKVNLKEHYVYEGIDAMCNIISWQPIKYVHQLQNLYFALTGEELTIKE